MSAETRWAIQVGEEKLHFTRFPDRKQIALGLQRGSSVHVLAWMSEARAKALSEFFGRLHASLLDNPKSSGDCHAESR